MYQISKFGNRPNQGKQIFYCKPLTIWMNFTGHRTSELHGAHRFPRSGSFGKLPLISDQTWIPQRVNSISWEFLVSRISSKGFLFWDEKMLFGNSFMYMADIIYYGLVHIKFIYRTSQAEIIQKQY